MPDFRFVHNPYTCIGCGACQVACKDLHGLLPGEFFRRVIPAALDGRECFISLSCGHCEAPACMDVCPNGAFFRAEDGKVRHHDELCIGCGKCVWSCPLGAISLSKTKGIARKCDGCTGGSPACVAACVNGSLMLACDGDPLPLSDVFPAASKPRIGICPKGGSHG